MGRALHFYFYDVKQQSRTGYEQRAEVAEVFRGDHPVKFTPTILVFDRDVSLLLATTGYQATPPESIVEHLKGLRK